MAIRFLFAETGRKVFLFVKYFLNSNCIQCVDSFRLKVETCCLHGGVLFRNLLSVSATGPLKITDGEFRWYERERDVENEREGRRERDRKEVER